MARIKIDTEALKLMSFFESHTHAKLKDCFTDSLGTLNFVVNEGINRAIGKDGSTFKKMEQSLRRRIKVVAFYDEITEFIASLIRPLKAKNIAFDDNTKVVTIDPEPESRGYIIGRAAQNLRNYESIVKRYFDIKEIKVV